MARVVHAEASRELARDPAEVVLGGEEVTLSDGLEDEWAQAVRERFCTALRVAALKSGRVPHWGRRVRWR